MAEEKKDKGEKAKTAGERATEALGGTGLEKRVAVLEHAVLTRLNVDLPSVAEELGVREK